MARNELPTGRKGGTMKGKSRPARSGHSDIPGQRASLPTAKLQATSPSRHVAKPAASWKLEDAKARFSELVRRAHDEGPQYVTVRGRPAVAIIDVAEFERLQPSEQAPLPFVQFMESLYFEGLNLERDHDLGRDVDL